VFCGHLFPGGVMGESDPGFGDRLMSGLDLKVEPKAAEARRIEVITGGRRRRWSDDEKARAVEASLEPGAVVSVVARQHGSTPQQLFTWRREARRRAQEGALTEDFVPVVVEAEATGGGLPEPLSPPAPTRPHSIELDVAGTSVFIWRGAEPAMVSAIIGALKAAK
jgi:transposase